MRNWLKITSKSKIDTHRRNWSRKIQFVVRYFNTSWIEFFKIVHLTYYADLHVTNKGASEGKLEEIEARVDEMSKISQFFGLGWVPRSNWMPWKHLGLGVRQYITNKLLTGGPGTWIQNLGRYFISLERIRQELIHQAFHLVFSCLSNAKGHKLRSCLQ